jgi:hypothetical protein
MAGHTVRVHARTREKLRRLSASTGRSTPELLEVSVDALERELLLDAANAAFAALRRDASEWERELAERSAWESTLSDDLAED